MNLKIPILRCIVVGDGTVGKTSLIISFTTNQFPFDMIPAVFDNYSSSVYLENMKFIPQITDTIGLEQYKSHRISSYQNPDVFIICFSLDSQSSFQNVESVWVPEIKENCQNVPFILVGTKNDLNRKISKKQCKQMKERIGAKDYIECSSLKQIHVKDVFGSAFKIAFHSQNSSNKLNKNFKCNIF